MAIFGKNDAPNQAKRNSEPGLGSLNLIGPGTIIKGEVETAGDIRIDGTVKGSIHTGAKVVIGEDAVVEGNIHCQNADVAGKIIGNIFVQELLTLKTSSALKGDINTHKLIVEAGANFEGNCKMGEYEERPAGGADKGEETGVDAEFLQESKG